MNNKFYITTPIYYVNDVPHIGHAYTTVAADVMARYRRLEGDEVFFLTGTDEHGQKVEKAAAAKGEAPIELADRVVKRFSGLWEKLNISNDDFVRTTEERHRKTAQELFRRVEEKGDIYLGEYEDWYCTPCETFLTENQLIDGNCPDCKRPVDKLKEESYFFKMSAYQERLLKHIEENPDFIQPQSRRNEIISFVKEGLRDLSISRTTFKWGIPVPGNERHVIYVWFDALTNYITAPGCFSEEERFNKFWPANVHLIGKDILRFHAVYWPTFLMAAGLPLPNKVFAHGWWTVEGEKMSKSLGNVVDPYSVADEFGVDPFRYFLMREVSFGLDGDYSVNAFIGRINSDLGNDLGNLLNRSLTMAEKYADGVIPAAKKGDPLDDNLVSVAAQSLRGYRESMNNLAFNRALDHLWELIRETNRYIDHSAPWKLAKEKDRLDTVIYTFIESLRHISIMLSPFMPESAKKMWIQLGIADVEDRLTLSSIEQWGAFPVGLKVKKGEILFPRVEVKKEEKTNKKQKEKLEKKADMENVISIDDFMKVELKAGIIKAAERVPKSEKLVRLQVDTGELRQVVAGIGKDYEPADLIGKQVAVVTNLKPVKLMGVESQGMILAAGGDGLKLTTFDGDVKAGTRIK
ncbi:MAG: methionine--tRNA ligase [Deltaproteobacteria bacterium]|nr:methionine--tRNA ligase [Deltaproteobacteria bacterium]